MSLFKKSGKKVFPAGIEPATFRVLSGCDNHYTTETVLEVNCAYEYPAYMCSHFPSVSDNQIREMPLKLF